MRTSLISLMLLMICSAPLLVNAQADTDKTYTEAEYKAMTFDELFEIRTTDKTGGADYHLGVKLLIGKDVERDNARAQRFFGSAAYKGHCRAALMAGKTKKKDRNNRNYTMSYCEYFEIAVRNGCKDADYEYDRAGCNDTYKSFKSLGVTPPAKYKGLLDLGEEKKAREGE